MTAEQPDVGRTAARLARHVELALGSVDLSLAQYRVLMQLTGGSEVSSRLASQLAVSPPSISTVVDGLVQRGLVTRQHSEDDRRRVALTLTAEGSQLLEGANTAARDRLHEIAAGLEDDELRERAFEGLALWHEALDVYRRTRRTQLESNNNAKEKAAV